MKKKISIMFHTYISLLAIILTAIFLYTLRLNSHPFAIHGDEAETAVQAIEIIEKNLSLIGGGWYDIPLLSFLPHTISMEIVGKTIAGNRVASVFFGIGTIVFTYLLTQLLFGKRPAIIASFLLSTSHMWVALSRFGTIYTQAGFLVVGTLYFFLRGFKRRSYIDFVLSGIFFALCFYSYYGARIIPVILFPLIIAYLIQKRGLKKRIVGILFFAITAIIVFFPQGTFFYQHPEAFLSRIKYVSITNSTSEQEYKNQSMPTIFIAQIRKTYEGILHYDNSGQYGYKGQLFDFASIIFALIGIIGAIIYWKKPGFTVVYWLFTSLLISQILTLGPPPIFLPRFVVGIPALFIICALGIETVLRLTIKYGILPKVVIVVVVGFITLNNLYIYFFLYPDQLSKGVAGDPNAYNATMIAQVINQTPKGTTSIFISEPHLHAEFGPFRFLNREKYRIPLANASGLTVDNFRPFENAIYIIYPPFLDKLSILKNSFPNGKTTNYYVLGFHRFTIFSP